MTPKSRQRFAGTLLLSVTFFAGCDGASSGPAVDGGIGERPSSAGARDVGVRETSAAKLDSSTFEARPIGPAPAVNKDGKLLVKGRARLIAGTGSCSTQPTASADGSRWCAFAQAGDSLGSDDLWVINVTQAIAGTVTCDGKDKNCLRLSTNFYTGAATLGGESGFDGDTLIYYADSSIASTADVYTGPVYAWRPGWTKGRPLTGKTGVTCSGQLRAAVAICWENLSDLDTATTIEFDLHAGPISDSDNSLLPKVDHIYPLRSAPGSPTDGVSQWRSGFTREGDYLAYSTGGKTSDVPETLYVVPIAGVGDMSKYIQVGSGISRWTFSPDGTKLYYFRDYNYTNSTDRTPKGSLTMADFPTGAHEVTLVDASSPTPVGYFGALIDPTGMDRGGLWVLTNVAKDAGAYQLLSDRNAPKLTPVIKSVNLAGGVDPLISNDLRFVMYSKAINTTDFSDGIATSDVYLSTGDGATTCTLTSGLNAILFGSPFPLGSGLVYWSDNFSHDTFTADGYVANPMGCASKKRFATGLDSWFPVRGEGLLFVDGTDQDVGNIRYGTIDSSNNLSATLPTVQGAVDLNYAILPSFQAMLYTLGATFAAADQGLYVYTKFPWNNPPSDGGVDGAAVPLDAAADSAAGN